MEIATEMETADMVVEEKIESMWERRMKQNFLYGIKFGQKAN